jgi:transposase
MFRDVSPEQRVPPDHPLLAVRPMAGAALQRMSPEFDQVYSRRGRPSIAPERLCRALLLQIFYTIRSERLWMEQLDYNLLFRLFIGLNTDDPVWDHSPFSTNRQRLFEESFAKRFPEESFAQAEAAGLTSDEHFSVDGTPVTAWASQKSVRPRARRGRSSTGCRPRS